MLLSKVKLLNSKTWRLIDHQFVQAKRTYKIIRAGNKKKDYSKNLGWRGWWSRMEAWRRIDWKEKPRMELKVKISKMKLIETFFLRSSGTSSISSVRKPNTVHKFSSNINGQTCSKKTTYRHFSYAFRRGKSWQEKKMGTNHKGINCQYIVFSSGSVLLQIDKVNQLYHYTVLCEIYLQNSHTQLHSLQNHISSE